MTIKLIPLHQISGNKIKVWVLKILREKKGQARLQFFSSLSENSYKSHIMTGPTGAMLTRIIYIKYGSLTIVTK